MRRYDCIVIDDEELSRDLLENFILKTESLRLLGKFKTPLEALPSLDDQFDGILFLDIQMPEMTGLELLEILKKEPIVIFTTAYDKYAIEGYQYSAVDYLLKPFGFTRFSKAVNKATDLLELRYQANNSFDRSNDFIVVKADRKLHKIFFKDIRYIQSEKEYLVYHTEFEKIMTLGSLKALEKELPSSDFLRIHRSFIVAKNRVKSFDSMGLDIGTIKLPVGASYRQDVKDRVFAS